MTEAREIMQALVDYIRDLHYGHAECVVCHAWKGHAATCEFGHAQAWLSRVEQSAAAPIQPVIETAGEIARLKKKRAVEIRNSERAIHEIIGQNTSLKLEVERLQDRLEMRHAWQIVDGEQVRVSVEPGSIPDGIECRDETIKLQDRSIEALRAKLATVKAETIERCAAYNDELAALDHSECEHGPGYSDGRSDASAAIRSLKTQGERT